MYSSNDTICFDAQGPYSLLRRYSRATAAIHAHRAIALGARYPKQCQSHTRAKLVGGKHVTAWLSSRSDAYGPLYEPSC